LYKLTSFDFEPEEVAGLYVLQRLAVFVVIEDCYPEFILSKIFGLWWYLLNCDFVQLVLEKISHSRRKVRPNDQQWQLRALKVWLPMQQQQKETEERIDESLMFPNPKGRYHLIEDEISGRIARCTRPLFICSNSHTLLNVTLYDFYISFYMLLISNSYILPLNIPFV
jgi:hypothetical protein